MGIFIALVVHALIWILMLSCAFHVWLAIVAGVLLLGGLYPIMRYGHRGFAGGANTDLTMYLGLTVLSLALLYPRFNPVAIDPDQSSIDSGSVVVVADQTMKNETPVVSTVGSIPSVPSAPIVQAARSQIGVTVFYDPAYVGLTYPNGDIAIERGVCTDVVIRALRTAVAMDLQKLLHEDMKAHFLDYPQKWNLSRPDKNIDHRRVPNLRCYFERQHYQLPVSADPNDYAAGDIVSCTVGNNLDHIVIVSDKIDDRGVPYIIHNIGSGTQEEVGLFSFPITGHYRIPQ